MNYPLIRPSLAALLLLATIPHLQAEVRCAKLFGDHMVLQRDLPVPVWGEAAPGEAVAVEFAGQTKSTKADETGKWRVTLDPLTTSAESRALTVQGTNKLTFNDVLVGEVWFCSGQSNMEKEFFPRKGQKPVDNYELEVAAANDPQLRLFQVPRTDLKQEGPGVFRWMPSSPETLTASKFSAAAYYFGRQVQQVLGVPVGLIHASFGGSHIDAWMPAEAYTGSLAGLEKRKYKAWVKGVQPTELYKSMITPYAPFAVRGFLWYQGETNLMDADIPLYAAKQTALIESWRKIWNEPDAPFYGVLIAPMDYSQWQKFPITDLGLPAFWEQQAKALSAPHTGFAVTTDLVANTHDIHPTNKREVGLRLARLALGETYGRDDIPARGPIFKSMRVDGNRLELTFDHADGLRARDSKPLTGFVISDEGQSFQPAQARIENGKVIVFSDQVSKPAAVRFAWHETPNANLINGAGLPAAPFRSDDWPVPYLRNAPSAQPTDKK